jgi:hypothetical protein
LVVTTTGLEPPQPDKAPSAASAPMPANKFVFFIFLPFFPFKVSRVDVIAAKVIANPHFHFQKAAAVAANTFSQWI